MRHLLHHPHFPDMIGEWAESADQPAPCECANDNGDEDAFELADPLLMIFARMDIAATRVW